MTSEFRVEFKGLFENIDVLLWIAADFEGRNIPVDYPQRKIMFLTKSVPVGYNIVENTEYENITLEKRGNKRYFEENCAEWFVNDVWEKT